MDPITVRGPDGRVFRFPADTPRETISATLKTFYETNEQLPDAAGPNTWQETIKSEDLAPEDTPTALLNQGYERDPKTGDYFRIVGNETIQPEEYQPPAEPSRPSTSPWEAAALSAMEQVPFGLDALAGLSSAVSGASYTENRNLLEQMAQQDREEQPLARNVGGVAGFGATLAVPMGAASRFVGAARTGGGRALRGAGVAGAEGAVYGAGTSRGSIQDRIEPTMVGAGGGALAGAALSRFAPRMVNQERAADLAAFERSNVDAIPAVVGGQAAQGMGATLRGNAIVGGPLQRAGDRMMTQVGEQRERIAASLGESSGAFQSGTALRRGATAAGKRLKDQAGALYETPAMRAMEESPARLRAENTQRAINETFEGLTTPGVSDYLRTRQGDIQRVGQAIAEAGGTATFRELKRLRENVGAMLDDPQIINTGQQAALRRVYGALSDDITAAAGKIGGDVGQRDAARANQAWRATRSRVDDVLQQFAVEPGNEQSAFENLVRMAKTKGSRASWPQVAQLRRSLSDAEWNDVSSGLIRTMGGEGDAFSPVRFATEWGTISPEARRLFFGKALPDMEALARVGDSMSRVSRFYNASQSGNTMQNIGTLQNIATGVGATGLAAMAGASQSLTPALLGIAGLGGGLAASKLLASPGFARWLYKAERAFNAGRDASRLINEAEGLAEQSPTVRQWLTQNRDVLASMLAGRQIGTGSAESAETARERQRAVSMTNPTF